VPPLLPRLPLWRRALAILVGVLVFAVVLPASVAQATPSAQDLANQVAQKGKDLDIMAEKYNTATVLLDRAKTQSALIAQQIPVLAQRVAAARDTVSALAAKAYEGATASQFNALMSAESPTDLVQRLSMLNSLARGQRQAITVASDASRKLQQQQTELDTMVVQQTAQQADLASQKSKIESDIATLKKQQDALSVNARVDSSGNNGLSNTPPTVSGKVALVIKYAYAQLGKSYVFGAAGPNTFDCSGLALMAWRQAGVQLLHSSWTQMNEETTRISRADLQPGDLVFFYGGEHVGIYVGNNDVIHAPKPGDVVKISSITWMGGYYALGRPR
jgi:cell wall-associated NlpC family hydrolase